MSIDWTPEEKEIWLRFCQALLSQGEPSVPAPEVLAAYFDGNASAAEGREVEAFLASHDHPSQFLEGEFDHVVSGDPPAQLILRAKALVPDVDSAKSSRAWWRRLTGGLTPVPAYGWATALVLLMATGGYFLGAATFEHERTVQVSINHMLTFGVDGPTNGQDVFN